AARFPSRRPFRCGSPRNSIPGPALRAGCGGLPPGSASRFEGSGWWNCPSSGPGPPPTVRAAPGAPSLSRPPSDLTRGGAPDTHARSFFEGSSARATGARCTRPRWACRQPAADRIPAPGNGPGAQPEGKEHMTEQSTAHHLREYETIFLVKPDLTDE